MSDTDQERKQDKREDRNININKNLPEELTNPIYTPAFLKEQIGRFMRVEFLIGANNMIDKIGVLEDVGESYILLRSLENDSLVFCDIYSIKFVTISNAGMYGSINNYPNMSNLASNPMMRGPMMY